MKHFSMILFSFCAVLFFIACNTAAPQYTLTGKFTGKSKNIYESRMVYLMGSDVENAKKLDSCIVDNNTFVFTEEIKEPNQLGYIKYEEYYNVPVMFIKEAGDIEIEIGDHGHRIAGTSANNSFQLFAESLVYMLLHDYPKYLDSLSNLKKNDLLTVSKFREIELEMDSFLENLDNYIGEYIFSKKKSPLAYHAFKSWNFLLTPSKRKEVFTQLYDGKSLEHMGKFREILDNAVNVEVGQKFLDIQGVDVDNNNITLTSIVTDNKVTLVDFWEQKGVGISFSQPEFQALYKKYNAKGFTIVGIPLDIAEGGQPWTSIVKEYDMVWPQIASLDSKNIMKQYAINGGPHAILIDQNGIIRASNTQFDDEFLEMKIQSLLEE